jgi:hypothetical protein
MYAKISNTFTETFKVDELRGSFDKGLQGMFDSILEGNTLEGFEKAGNEVYAELTELGKKFKEEGSKNWEDFINDENKLIKVITTLKDQLVNLGTEGIEGLKKKISEITGKSDKQGGGDLNPNQGGGNLNPNQGGGNLNPNQGGSNLNPNQGGSNLNPEPNPYMGPFTSDTFTSTTKVPFKPVAEVDDFIYTPPLGQKVSFPDIPKFGTLQALDKDKLEIRGGTRTNEDLGGGGETNINFTLNINVSGNGVSKADIQNVMNDSSMIESLKKELQKITAPNGTISPTEQRKRNNKEKFR